MSIQRSPLVATAIMVALLAFVPACGSDSTGGNSPATDVPAASGGNDTDVTMASLVVSNETDYVLDFRVFERNANDILVQVGPVVTLDPYESYDQQAPMGDTCRVCAYPPESTDETNSVRCVVVPIEEPVNTALIDQVTGMPEDVNPPVENPPDEEDPENPTEDPENPDEVDPPVDEPKLPDNPASWWDGPRVCSNNGGQQFAVDCYMSGADYECYELLRVSPGDASHIEDSLETDLEIDPISGYFEFVRNTNNYVCDPSD